jgi:hypothetical protein
MPVPPKIFRPGAGKREGKPVLANILNELTRLQAFFAPSH